MGSDAEEPAAQGEQRPELLPCPVNVQEGDLEEIVRCRRLAERAQEEAVQSRCPAPEKLRERMAVAGRIARHQLLVGQAIPLRPYAAHHTEVTSVRSRTVLRRNRPGLPCVHEGWLKP